MSGTRSHVVTFRPLRRRQGRSVPILSPNDRRPRTAGGDHGHDRGGIPSRLGGLHLHGKRGVASNPAEWSRPQVLGALVAVALVAVAAVISTGNRGPTPTERPDTSAALLAVKLDTFDGQAVDLGHYSGRTQYTDQRWGC